jgi:nucleoside-diphosphate-sugar epimerase
MSQPTIFITGATGFIGSQVTAHSLAAGYNVCLSVRKAAQIDKLKRVFAKNAAHLDFVVIPDLTQAGAYDQALQNVDYIFHIASPMPGTGDDFKTTYLAPAVQGTTGLLEAAEKVGTVKRVVVMSSVVALIPMHTFIESTFHAKGTHCRRLCAYMGKDLTYACRGCKPSNHRQLRR